jgi:hypothetical protein
MRLSAQFIFHYYFTWMDAKHGVKNDGKTKTTESVQHAFSVLFIRGCANKPTPRLNSPFL